ncbi:hypothetical protein DUI87_23760 [Hirundo rustica rustica]|uniref:Integrase catalytic domain-containing protein n=1 Tax=Hirundo rustica rustica TaxID=333673 RepID=A0A3M0JFY6_HIRRU|nr:hypothetical protein DUI87_23760 [Hirundo rustica rustica]
MTFLVIVIDIVQALGVYMDKKLRDLLQELWQNPKKAVDNDNLLIQLEHVCGDGEWVSALKQAQEIPLAVLEHIKDAASKEFFFGPPNGPFQPYSKIKQLPSEPFVTFVKQLTRAIELQVKKEGAQEQVLEAMALTNANKQCKAAILSLPREPAPTLDDMLQLSSLVEKNHNWRLTCRLKPQKVPKKLEEPLGEHMAEESHAETDPSGFAFTVESPKHRNLQARAAVFSFGLKKTMGVLQRSPPNGTLLPEKETTCSWNPGNRDWKFFCTKKVLSQAKGVIGKEGKGKLDFHHHWSKRMTKPQTLVAELIRKARTRIRELSGCDFECIHVPIEVDLGQITKAMLEHLLHENEALQFALDSYTGEKSSDAMKHLIQTFSFLGIPKSMKTDNGPMYTSKEFRSFLQQWGVEHKTSTPYSLTERTANCSSNSKATGNGKGSSNLGKQKVLMI